MVEALEASKLEVGVNTPISSSRVEHSTSESAFPRESRHALLLSQMPKWGCPTEMVHNGSCVSCVGKKAATFCHTCDLPPPYSIRGFVHGEISFLTKKIGGFPTKGIGCFNQRSEYNLSLSLSLSPSAISTLSMHIY